MARLKINIGPSINRLDLAIKGNTNSKFMGNYASVFKGQGLEFEDFRAFSPDDDASKIDWKTSARSDKILVKEFIEERNIDVFFLVDVSSKMMLGSVKRLKAEYVADLVASLSYVILNAGDRVGLTLFSDVIKKVVHPEIGAKHFYTISNTLSNLGYYGGDCNIKNVTDFVIRSQKKGSVVFLISDFIVEENLEKSLGFVGHKFDFVSIIVRDPIDLKLPLGIGQVMIEDPSYGEKLLVSPKSVEKEYSIEVNAQLKKIKREFARSNVDFIELNTKTSFVKGLVEFFEKRKKRWR